MSKSNKKVKKLPDIYKKQKHYQKAYKIMFPFAFILVPFGAIALMIVISKMNKYNIMVKIIDYIKNKDKVVIVTILGYNKNGSQLLQNLIDSGYLENYHIVADVVIVKNELMMTEQEAMEEYSKYANPALASSYGLPMPLQVNNFVNCPKCNKLIDINSTNFCPNCGEKLK